MFGDGTLCLDIIQDKWKPVYTVNSILTSIQVRAGRARRRRGAPGRGALARTAHAPAPNTPSRRPATPQSLLCDPNLDSPANVDAARVLKSNPKEYKRRVREVVAKSLEA